MAVDWVGFQNFITAIGSVLGIVSFIFIVDRKLKEKPILDISQGRTYYIVDHDGRFHISVELNIDNTGERGTSIKGVKILSLSNIDLFNKIKDFPSRGYEYIQPHSSSSIHWTRQVQDYDIKENELIGELELSWTHDSTIILVKISRDKRSI